MSHGVALLRGPFLLVLLSEFNGLQFLNVAVGNAYL
jgi:hypothetical protein